MVSLTTSDCIELADMRHANQGWSLRCTKDIRKGAEVLRVPWDSVLDSRACVRFLSSGICDDVGPRVSAFLQQAVDEDHEDFVFGAALLVMRWRSTSLSAPVRMSATQCDAAELFCTQFHWILDVVEECGELGIPLCWGRPGHSAAAQSLICDRHLLCRVTEDVEACRKWLENYLNVAYQAKPDDKSNEDFRRYVAWVRSRWLCFSDTRSPVPSTHSKKAAKNVSRHAVVPLVEKLNHNAHALMCPTVSPGEYVSLVADYNNQSPNTLRRGDELFISYGALRNATLWERYGFVIRPQLLQPAEAASCDGDLSLMQPLQLDCPADTVEISLPLVTDAFLDSWRISRDCVAASWVVSTPILLGAVPNPSLQLTLISTPIRFAVGLLIAEESGIKLTSAVEEDIASGDDSDEGGLGFGADEDSWYFSDERMNTWLKAHVSSLDILTRLKELVSSNILAPAEETLRLLRANDVRISQFETAPGPSSLYWAESYAALRRNVATRLLKILS